MGADGTIGTSPGTKPNSTPLNGLSLPVGDYPDSWGMMTDITIAQTTVFPNFFAPPSQWANIKGFIVLDPYTVSSRRPAYRLPGGTGFHVWHARYGPLSVGE